jgi:hypothetical protein
LILPIRNTGLNSSIFPNQSICDNAKAGKLLKDIERRAGVLDCLLAVSKENCSGMFIDFKSNSGELTEAQSRFIKEMIIEGYKCVEINSLDQFISIISTYLGESKRYMEW